MAGWARAELRVGPEVGGWRYFLNGHPIHCGAKLQLRAADPNVAHPLVRYEVEWRGDKPHSVLYAELVGYQFRTDLEEWMDLRWPQ